MGKRIYLKNLPYSTDQEALEEGLREVFSDVGTVVSLIIVYEGTVWRPKGLCFVEMGTEAEAHQAIAELNGLRVLGHRLEVREARPKLLKPRAVKNKSQSPTGKSPQYRK